jgi:hypothetical protein
MISTLTLYLIATKKYLYIKTTELTNYFVPYKKICIQDENEKYIEHKLLLFKLNIHQIFSFENFYFNKKNIFITLQNNNVVFDTIIKTDNLYALHNYLFLINPTNIKRLSYRSFKINNIQILITKIIINNINIMEYLNNYVIGNVIVTLEELLIAHNIIINPNNICHFEYINGVKKCKKDINILNLLQIKLSENNLFNFLF